MLRAILISFIFYAFLLSGFSIAMGGTEQFLVGYWPFDEGVGEDPNDVSGNKNHGAFVGKLTWVEGKYGKALEFREIGSHVVVKDSASLDLSDGVTYMFWFSTDVPIAGSRFMSKNNSIFVLTDFGAANSIAFLVKPGNAFAETTTVKWENKEWYHFAGTYGDKTLQVYVNGEMEGEAGGVPAIALSNLDLWIGADDLPASFAGVMDDVRIYSKALTEAEIKEAMEEPMAVEMTQNKLPAIWGALKTAN